jgi:hypothetical protein
MVANMASIIADIGDRSAPAAGADRRGPSRICIRNSRWVPALPRILRAGALPSPAQQGPAMAAADEISAPPS